jgi:type I restriction enzyme S subunit
MICKKYKISDVCSLIKGTYPTLKTEPGKYPLVVTAAYRRSASTYQLDGPAVCVPLISSTGHGDAAIHRVHYQDGKFALANLLVALLPRDSNLCDAKYLYYLLSAKKNEYFVPLMLGTANVSLKEHDIAGVEIPLPPIEEQRRVVTKLATLESQIDDVKREKKELDADIYRFLFAAYWRIIENAHELPMIDVAPLERRPVPVNPLDQYDEIGIRSFGKGTFHKTPVSGIELGTKKIFRIESGDLLFNIVFAWEGAVAVAQSRDHGRVGSHRFLTCVPKSNVATAAFLCFHFLTERGLEQLGEASPGGAGRNRTLGLASLENIKVPIPEFKGQLWFDSIKTKLDALASVKSRSEAELGALFPSLLYKAFRGEL